MRRAKLFCIYLLIIVAFGLSGCRPVSDMQSPAALGKDAGAALVSPIVTPASENAPQSIRILVYPGGRNIQTVQSWVEEQSQWVGRPTPEIVTAVAEGETFDIVLLPRSAVTSTLVTGVSAITDEVFVAQYVAASIPSEIVTSIGATLLPKLVMAEDTGTTPTPAPTTVTQGGGGGSWLSPAPHSFGAFPWVCTRCPVKRRLCCRR